MLGADETSSESLYPTDFDISRLSVIEIGNTVDGELGNWSVIRYKNEYVLLLHNSKKYSNFMEMKNLETLLYFLKKG